jgi:hypothetical protein
MRRTEVLHCVEKNLPKSGTPVRDRGRRQKSPGQGMDTEEWLLIELFKGVARLGTNGRPIHRRSHRGQINLEYVT